MKSNGETLPPVMPRDSGSVVLAMAMPVAASKSLLGRGKECNYRVIAVNKAGEGMPSKKTSW